MSRLQRTPFRSWSLRANLGQVDNGNGPLCRRVCDPPGNPPSYFSKCPRNGESLNPPLSQVCHSLRGSGNVAADSFTTLIEGGTMRKVTYVLGTGLLLVMVFSGCNELVPSGDTGVKNAKPAPIAPVAAPAAQPVAAVPNPPPEPPVVEEPSAQETAKEILTKAFDSWLFGKTVEEFEKNNPDIVVIDFDWVLDKILLNYDILQTRPTDDGIKAVVVLTYVSRSGQEIKEKKDYHVAPGSSGEWLFSGTDE